MMNASAGTERGSSVATVADAAAPVRRPRAGRVSAGLVWTLVRTDFKARYHGTLGGFVWALLKPLCMFLVLMSVFSLLFASNPTYKLDLIVGLFLWDFFAEGTKVGLTSLHARGYLLTKARVRPWILVVTSISNAAITLAVFSVVIAIFLTLAGHAPGARALAAFAMYCLALVAIVIAFSLASSVLFLRYRDLNQVWDVAIQAGFFVAPIIYPLGILPERFHKYLYVWPPTPIVEFSRAALVGGVLPTRTAHLYLFLDAAACLVAGIAIFRWFSPRAAEYL
jgi:homopolymeric O-antigen transport system permease protein